MPRSRRPPVSRCTSSTDPRSPWPRCPCLVARLLVLAGTVSLLIAARASAQDRVVCADPDDCPAAVALLGISLGDGEQLSCTAFLVGPDTLVTASHCVPDLVQRGLVPCGEALEAHFPALPHAAAEDVACAEVIHVSPLVEEALMAIDYAVLRLARPVDRAPLALSRAGVPDGAGVRLWVTDPGRPAVVHRRDCRAAQSTVDFPPFDRDGAPTVMARGCGTVHGNSGSPLVDDRGVVRAVVTGLGRTGAEHLWGEGGPLARLVDDVGQMTFATNLAALPDLGASYAIGARGAGWMEGTLVASLEASITPVFVQSSLAKLRSAADAALAEWAAMTRTPIEWRVVSRRRHGLSGELTAAPVCVRGELTGPTVHVPVWRATLERDADHHVIARARQVGMRAVRLRRHPAACPADFR